MVLFQMSQERVVLTRGYWPTLEAAKLKTSTDRVRWSSSMNRSPPKPPVDSLMPNRPATGPIRLPNSSENRSSLVVVTVVTELVPVTELLLTTREVLE